MTPEPHLVPLALDSTAWLEIRESRTSEIIRLETTWNGSTWTGEGDRFEDALEALMAQLPDSVRPVLCGRCAFALLDPFGASDGRDDLSCFRERKDLAREFRAHGRKAPAEVFEYLYRHPVCAFHRCEEFESV